MRNYINLLEAISKGCPTATHDIDVNLKNRQKAIDDYHYGPANPERAEDYWSKSAKIFRVSVATARTMLCGNCGAFDVSDSMRECIANGIKGDEPSVDEIRNLVKYNFASQNRAVTIKDYQARISMMPGEFGVPFRCGVFEEQNKVKIYTLGLNSNSQLDNSSTSTLMNNIATYLADYRMLND